MIIPIKYANIRSAVPDTDTIYLMTDPGRRGYWYPDFNDTTSADNGWGIVVTTPVPGSSATPVRIKRDLTVEQPRLS